MESYTYYMIFLILLTDEEFQRLANGDPEIIEKLYEEYQKKITTYFIIKTFGNRAIAEDLTHETFCSIIESVQRLKNKDKLTFWVFTIAKRTLVKYQRQFFRKKKYTDIMKNNYVPPPDFIEILHKKQKLLLFKMAVDTLKPVYRQIFDLRFDECHSVKKIAEITGKTEKSVENLLRRAKTKLKERMLVIGNNFFSEEGGGGNG